MAKKIKFLCIYLIFIQANCIAQVTIGSKLAPQKGVLLELRQNANLGANSDKGMILPRVKLTSRDDLDIAGGATGLDASEHIGLLVYNMERKDGNEGVTVRDAMLCPGLHIWSGSTWTPLKPYPAKGLMCDGSDPGEFTKCGDPLRDIEDNEYPTGKFGAAGCWMTRNLVSTKNTNITLTENTNASNALDKAYFAKPNTTETNKTYGYLYTWQAAIANLAAEESLISTDQATKKSTLQGICPAGWVIPSDLDWNNLEAELASNPSLYSDLSSSSQAWTPTYANTSDWRPFVSGGDISKGWGQSFRSKTLINNVNHTYSSKSKTADENGFDALLIGTLQSGAAQGYGNYAGMWTSNDAFTPIGGDDSANYRGLWHGNNGVYRGSASKSSMLSVRCKLAE